MGQSRTLLRIVSVKNLKPNPYRRLAEYPIHREKVDALKESIESTGFWGTIVARPRGADFEIAFGHHRMMALKEIGRIEVEIIVRDLSNDQMIKMMAKENMEEWGTSAWVELETIRSVIEAHGKGELEDMPPVPDKTRDGHIRHVTLGSVSHPYTKAAVAEFLGWTKKNHDNGLQPNSACEVAFRALDLIDDGLLNESDLKGLSRDQMRTLVEGQWGIHQKQLAAAKAEEEAAERARQRAVAATQPREKEVMEKRASVHASQAKQHKADATDKAKAFAKAGAETIRSGGGVRQVKAMADAEKAKIALPKKKKIPNPDKFADTTATILGSIANGADNLSDRVKLLKQSRKDLSDRAANGLCQSFTSLIARLERMRSAFRPTTRSHEDGTEIQHGRQAIGNGSTRAIKSSSIGGNR